MIKRFISGRFMPTNTDIGLLALRVGMFLNLFIRHGWEKFAEYDFLSTHIPDPLHIGVKGSFFAAMIADSILSIFLIFGFATRLSALFVLSTLVVAWTLVDKFAYIGHRQWSEHGEVTLAYIAALVAVIVMGPGRYSVDAQLAE